MSDLEIRPLTRDDVPAEMELSAQAGWNQNAADWHRLLDLAPTGCFAGWTGGELVATGTLVTYADEIGWIGMILVDEDHRRNGYGSAMFDRVRELAESRNVTAGLDATDAGREVYRRVDFVDVAPIERWHGRLSPSSDPPSADVAPLRDDGMDAVRSLDRRATGVDRGGLLDHLFAEDGVTGIAVGTDPRGYAVVRPGREHHQVGPLVARSTSDVEALLHGVSEAIGDDTVLIDVLEIDAHRSLLQRLGLTRQRRLTRMTRGEPTQLLVGEDVVAAAGFELG